jgi:hypothetical protein
MSAQKPKHAASAPGVAKKSTVAKIPASEERSIFLNIFFTSREITLKVNLLGDEHCLEGSAKQ